MKIGKNEFTNQMFTFYYSIEDAALEGVNVVLFAMLKILTDISLKQLNWLHNILFSIEPQLM